MAIRTSLTLSEEQLKRMIGYVRSKVQAIESERTQWIAERERYEAEWDDDFSHRVSPGSVFAKNNDSINLVGSGADWLQARLAREIFGTRPLLAVDPVSQKGDDPKLAEDIQRHLEWKLERSQIDFPGAALQAITKAIRSGEGVLKISYKEDVEEYERIASVLCDRKGNPITSSGGSSIFEESGTEVIRQLPEGQAPSPGVVEAIVTPSGHPEIVLGERIDGEIILNTAYQWAEKIVTDEVVNYSGAKAIPLHFKEFYCPLSAPSIHEADFVAHMTEMRLSALRAQLGIGEDDETPESERGGADFIRQALARIKGDSAQHKSASHKAQAGEIDSADIADGDPIFRYLECYFTFDARQTGRAQRIFLALAYDHDTPIFWDYIQNVTPKGRYPFEAVRIMPKDGRWYGIGWFKKYEMFQTLVDRLLNQIIYRNDLAANPIKFRRKEAVEQWEDGQPFEIGPDRVFDLKEGYSHGDALSTSEIPQLDQQTRYLFETAVASWRTRSGVSTATQGEAGGMPAENTATGVSYLAESSNTMFSKNVLAVKDDLEATLRQVVAYQYAYQSMDETFLYVEGEESTLLSLSPQRVRDIELDIRLSLTNARQSENLAKNQQAASTFERFITLPTQYKRVAAGLYVSLLKNVGIDNPEQYTDGVIDADEAAMQAQQQAAYELQNPGTDGPPPDPQASPAGGEAIPELQGAAAL